MNTTLLFINDYNESCVCSYYKKNQKISIIVGIKKNNPNGLFFFCRYGSWTYCSIEDNTTQDKDLLCKIL